MDETIHNAHLVYIPALVEILIAYSWHEYTTIPPSDVINQVTTTSLCSYTWMSARSKYRDRIIHHLRQWLYERSMFVSFSCVYSYHKQNIKIPCIMILSLPKRFANDFHLLPCLIRDWLHQNQKVVFRGKSYISFQIYLTIGYASWKGKAGKHVSSDSDKVYSTKIDANTMSGLHEFLRDTNNTMILIYR